MIKKKVWRYYCGFCKKANCSGASISKHEKHCTGNINRICRMCKFSRENQPNLQDLIKILPNIKDYKKNDTNYLGSFTSITYGNLEEKLTEILPKLRHESGNCPVCILAAIRQAKIPVYLMKDFDFKKECEEIFKQRNADMEDERSYY